MSTVIVLMDKTMRNLNNGRGKLVAEMPDIKIKGNVLHMSDNMKTACDANNLREEKIMDTNNKGGGVAGFGDISTRDININLNLLNFGAKDKADAAKAAVDTANARFLNAEPTSLKLPETGKPSADKGVGFGD